MAPLRGIEDIMKEKMGGFTLPGESGYEQLTLELADKWGADVIRDSDGTELSEEILNTGYGIYSTVCIIRGHNEWAKNHADQLQQTFLITAPVLATDKELAISLLHDFSTEQFQINDSEDSMKYWQVYDRTIEREIGLNQWVYRKDTNEVILSEVAPWHEYTVSFLAYRIWEEISMYNHTTNGWDKEHLMPIDPRYPETKQYLLYWMKEWCEKHEHTTVVRFTSLFYNFVWIWGSSEKNRFLFTDWASYDFTVSPLALDEFEKKYHYRLTAEDFVNKGQYQVTHMPATKQKLDWMDFIQDFVLSLGKELVQIVHDYGKEAYVFYDDSWVGLEPYHKRFSEYGFDGIIKAVFSGFESRLCSGVHVKTHELRLHPYLFPVGVDGSPSFLEGGDPTLEAKRYWRNIRRAMLREPIDRIGLGGYLHLVEEKPDFIAYISELAKEFRQIKELHKKGTPTIWAPKIAVLHSWGELRSWTLSGHFHETNWHPLIHINESLAGLPFEVDFLNFEDIKKGRAKDYDVIINAGRKGDAWSGGYEWEDETIVSLLTKWVYQGGVFLGVMEPSAVDGFHHTFRMAHVLGVDIDQGARVCHGKWKYIIEDSLNILPCNCRLQPHPNLYLTNGEISVLKEEEGIPTITKNAFGKGFGIYLSSYEHTPEHTRLLVNLILSATQNNLLQEGMNDNLYTESAYFPQSQVLVVWNNTNQIQKTFIVLKGESINCELEPYETKFLSVGLGL